MAGPLQFSTNSAEETQDIGETIGALAQAGDVFLLTGPLGAGKTCLTQGIAKGLGVTGYVRSPTFVIMTKYRGRLTLHHVDLYRLDSPEEAWDLGLDEQLSGDGVCVVEWANRAADVFTEDCLWIDLDYAGVDDDKERRNLIVEDYPKRYLGIVEKLAAQFPMSGEVKR